MKRYIIMILVAAAMYGCAKTEIGNEPATPGGKVQFFATNQEEEQLQTRASGNKWDANDPVGIFATKAGQALDAVYASKAVNKHFKIIDATNGTMSPEAGNDIFYPTNGDALDFYAYYPYREWVVALYKVDVKEQSDFTKIDLMWAKAANQSGGKVALRFKHQLTMVKLDVVFGSDLTGATAVMKGAYATADFNIGTGIFTAQASADIPLIMKVDDTDKTKATITAMVVPSAAGVLTDRKVEITLGDKTTTHPIASDAAWESGKYYTYVISDKHFIDANFRATLVADYGLEEANGDIDPNNETNKAKFASITELDLGNKSIVSLQGIEYFTALTTLNCAKNQLTSLDISKNTALDKLLCNENQLTALDVSENKALDWLDCYINQLTTLDVSQNTVLTILNCQTNQLTSLDLSKNTVLKYLSCNDNKIMQLDVSYNKLLKSLNCFTNQLTSLDISNNTELTSINCSDNQITNLDVSKHTKFTTISCRNNKITSLDISQNQEITMLLCNNNQIKSLDVSKNTKLYQLECAGNQLTVLDIRPIVAIWAGYEYLGNQSGQMTLMLTATQNAAWERFKNEPGNANVTTVVSIPIFTDAAFRKVLVDTYGLVQTNGDIDPTNPTNASKFTSITELNVRKKGIGSLKGIEYFTALTTLACSENQLTTLDVSNNTALAWLSCASNQLSTLDLSTNTALLMLHCDNNELSTLDLSKNIELGSLDCYSNKLIALDITLLTKLNVENSFNCGKQSGALTLTLTAAQQTVWEAGAKNKANNANVTAVMPLYSFPDNAFRDALVNSYGFVATNGKIDINNPINKAKLESITELQIQKCGISSLEGLEHFTALATLNCGSNNITKLDLSKNTALSQLICDYGQLSTLDVSQNTALTYLDCDYAELTTLDVSKNIALEELYCSNNNSSKLASLTLPESTALTTLICTGNKLTTLDVSKSTGMIDLDCDGNNLEALDITPLVKLDVNQLLCGYQREQKTLTLTLTAAQKVVWEEKAKGFSANSNVNTVVK